ncbi:hypothetical protein [Bradyrhizobium sp. BRP22]|nr:hypothetical protein [Bradyrhizobium sp. BRP22]
MPAAEIAAAGILLSQQHTAADDAWPDRRRHVNMDVDTSGKSGA